MSDAKPQFSEPRRTFFLVLLRNKLVRMLMCGFCKPLNRMILGPRLVIFNFNGRVQTRQAPGCTGRAKRRDVWSSCVHSEGKTTQRHGQIGLSGNIFIIWVRVQAITLLSLRLHTPSSAPPLHLHLRPPHSFLSMSSPRVHSLVSVPFVFE